VRSVLNWGIAPTREFMLPTPTPVFYAMHRPEQRKEMDWVAQVQVHWGAALHRPFHVLGGACFLRRSVPSARGGLDLPRLQEVFTPCFKSKA